MVKRGSVVLMAASRACNKVRPTVVVQTEESTEFLDSLTVCRLTSEEAEGSVLRIPIAPSEDNGLHKPSWVQTEKVMTIPQVKAGPVIGAVSDADMRNIEIALATHLNLYAPEKPME
jgi:mRNA interferase MazF